MDRADAELMNAIAAVYFVGIIWCLLAALLIWTAIDCWKTGKRF